MGLAAPQARLLMLTARQDDVEARLMTIANQKVSLSRESAQISEDYEQALSATKFVWNADGSDCDLEYSLFDPTTMADYNYMLTDTATDAVMLTDNQLYSLGLSTTTGTGSDFTSVWPSQNAFIAEMVGEGVSASDVRAAKTSLRISDSTDIVHFQTNYSDSTIYNYLASNCTISTNVADYAYSAADSPNVVEFTDTDSNGDQQSFIYEGAIIDIVKNICSNTADALDASLQANFGKNWSKVEDQIHEAQEYARMQTIYYYEDVSDAGGRSKDSSSGIYNLYGNGGANDVTDDDDVSNSIKVMRLKVAEEDAASNNAGVIDGWNRDTDYNYMDANQVLKIYLNYFDAACADINASGTTDEESALGDYYRNKVTNPYSYSTKETVDTTYGASGSYSYYSWGSVSRPDDEDGLYGTSGTGEDCTAGVISGTYTTGSGVKISSDKIYFYESLYEELAANGWKNFPETTNENKTLQTELLYGSVTIKGYSDTEYAWNSICTSDCNSPVTQENDDNAATRAESLYDAEKNKLQYKEQLLDTESNNLDSERSEISSEIDSINNVLKQHYEDFKIFQNG